MRWAVGLLCLLPITASAQSAWGTREADGKTIAAICSDEADETCVLVYCEIADAQAQIALVSPDAWSVQAGSKELLVLGIGDGGMQIIEGEIASAPGFGLEYFAVAAPLSPAQVGGLKASAAFTVGRQGGRLTTLPLTGSSAAINQALVPPCR